MSALAQSGAAGVKEVFRAQLEQALNNLLKAELAGFLGYDSYERCGFNSGDSAMAFMKFPPQIRIALYSTNQIESFNKRLKRKTKAKEQFPTAESLDNFVGQQVLSYNQSAAARRIARGFSGILDTIESYFD